MAFEFAGAFDSAVFDSNSQLLKNTPFELVTEPGGVLASLYTNRTRSAPVAQPFLSDAEGNVHLFTDPGRYRLRQAGSPPGEEITVQPDPDETEGELEAHVIAADPHPVYLTTAEGNAAYDATGTAAAGDSAHVAAGDPHPVYETGAEHDARDHSVPAGTVVLDDLQNVTVPAPVLNDVLIFDGTDWVSAALSSVPAGTAGSLAFWNALGTTITEDPVNAFYDDVNNRAHFGPRATPGAALGTVNVYPASAGALGLVVKGLVGQAASLIQLQNGVGTVLSRFDAAGRLGIGGAPQDAIHVFGAVDSGIRIESATVALSPELDLFTAGVQRARFGWSGVGFGTQARLDSTTGHLIASASGFGTRFSTTTSAPALGKVSVHPEAAQLGVVVVGNVGQAANLLDLLDSTLALLFSFDEAGFPTWVAAKEQLTVGAVGVAAALPGNPAKYLQVKDSSGVTYVIPAWLAA